MSNHETLGRALRNLRQQRGFGIRELARRAGTSKRSIQDWETDRYVPSGAALDRLLVALEATERVRSRLLARTAPAYARVQLAHTPLGAPIDLGQILRAMRRRQGSSQAEVARAAGVSQGMLSRWESGDSIPSPEALHGALFALGATPEEALAVASVEQGEPATNPSESYRASLHRALTAPPALRDVLLLGIESEWWWKATQDAEAEAETAVCHIRSTRAHQCLMRGDLDEVEGHVRRALRLFRSTDPPENMAAAVFAGCWMRQRGRGDATGAARSLGKWSERMNTHQHRQWLRSAQGFAVVRAGDAPAGIAMLERLAGEAIEREHDDIGFYQTDLIEAYLLANQPERAAEVLASMDDSPGPLPVAKTLLAQGEEPPPETLAAARTFGTTSWGAAQEAAQIERGLKRVRRGGRARFV